MLDAKREINASDFVNFSSCFRKNAAKILGQLSGVIVADDPDGRIYLVMEDGDLLTGAVYAGAAEAHGAACPRRCYFEEDRSPGGTDNVDQSVLANRLVAARIVTLEMQLFRDGGINFAHLTCFDPRNSNASKSVKPHGLDAVRSVFTVCSADPDVCFGVVPFEMTFGRFVIGDDAKALIYKANQFGNDSFSGQLSRLLKASAGTSSSAQGYFAESLVYESLFSVVANELNFLGYFALHDSEFVWLIKVIFGADGIYFKCAETHPLLEDSDRGSGYPWVAKITKKCSVVNSTNTCVYYQCRSFGDDAREGGPHMEPSVLSLWRLDLATLRWTRFSVANPQYLTVIFLSFNEPGFLYLTCILGLDEESVGKACIQRVKVETSSLFLLAAVVVRRVIRGGSNSGELKKDRFRKGLNLPDQVFQQLVGDEILD